VLEFGVRAGADLQSSEPLVGDAERCIEDGDRDADALPLGTQLPATGLSVAGLFSAP
jgi:hypothetical protein